MNVRRLKLLVIAYVLQVFLSISKNQKNNVLQLLYFVNQTESCWDTDLSR